MITTTTQKPINEILAYRNEAVTKRYQRYFGGTDEDVNKCFYALMQYLALCGTSTAPVRQTSEAIDQMWHTFILFTKDYRDFCETYIGRFIDHDPTSRSDAEPVVVTRERAKLFSLNLEPKYWLGVGADCSGCCSCNGSCNVKPDIVE